MTSSRPPLWWIFLALLLLTLHQFPPAGLFGKIPVRDGAQTNSAVDELDVDLPTVQVDQHAGENEQQIEKNSSKDEQLAQNITQKPAQNSSQPNAQNSSQNTAVVRPPAQLLPLQNNASAPGPDALPATVIINSLVPTVTLASFFYANVMTRFGSGRLKYTDRLEFEVRMDLEENFLPVPEGSLCIIAMRYHQKKSVTKVRDTFYPTCHMFVMGDEFCNVSDALDPVMSFRQFESKAFSKPPPSIPLGPRNDFWEVLWTKYEAPLAMTPASTRPALYNAIFSKRTSESREQLATVLESDSFGPDLRQRGIVHLAEGWAFEPTEETGHFSVEQYTDAVLNSTFTLSPVGHNPECFRIYEAIEAGSIPIIALDDSYKNHQCVGSLDPMRESGAPIIFLDSWNELPNLLRKYRHAPEEADRLQIRLQRWYVDYMSERVRVYEDRLLQPIPKLPSAERVLSREGAPTDQDRSVF